MCSYWKNHVIFKFSGKKTGWYFGQQCVYSWSVTNHAMVRRLVNLFKLSLESPFVESRLKLAFTVRLIVRNFSRRRHDRSID